MSKLTVGMPKFVLNQNIQLAQKNGRQVLESSVHHPIDRNPVLTEEFRLGIQLEPTHQEAITKPRRTTLRCSACTKEGTPAETTRVRCNVRKFRDQTFQVRRCPNCQTIQTQDVVNLSDYYRSYPMRNAHLDYFSRVWYGIFLKRLVRAGLKKEHHILDYGCGHGLFLDFLRAKGYTKGWGFDAYVNEFKDESVLKRTYDWVLGMDVIEHDNNPEYFMAKMARLLNPNGRLCLETPNAVGLDFHQAEKQIHTWHVPYHRHLFSPKGLTNLAARFGLVPTKYYSNYFRDSWLPGTSRSFIDALLWATGNDFDSIFENPSPLLFLKYPSLLFKFFFGFFTRKKRTDEMMMILTQRVTSDDVAQKLEEVYLV